MEELSQLELAFCVDLTASMTPFLRAAQTHMVDIITALSNQAMADMRVAIVGYRDYGSRFELVEVYPFTSDRGLTKEVLQNLQSTSPPENTDAAEAVFAGLEKCLSGLEWRQKADRILVLVGDAPPHACGAIAQPYPDRFPKADPTGQTLMSIGAKLEASGITLYSLGLVPSLAPVYDKVMEECFQMLALTTGGTYRRARSSSDAMAVVAEVGKRVFGQMDLDRKLWLYLSNARPEAGFRNLTAHTLIERALPELENLFSASSYQIHSSLERLRKRGFFR
jgi:hypothetical protein